MYVFCDLFSGSGGMSSGFQATGKFKAIGAVDIEKAKPSSGIGVTNCNETYHANVGLQPLSADISELLPSDLASHFGFSKGDLDVLISCAPCTGFSQKIADNNIVDDPRNALVARTALFVEEFKPKYLVMENVKELIRGKHRHHFQALSRALQQLGYKIYAEIHDLSLFGLPQKRLRALLVAKRDDMPNIRIPRATRLSTVREVISHLPPIKAGETHPEDPMHTCPSHNEVTLARMRAIPSNGGSWSDIPPELDHLLIPSMKSRRAGSYPDAYGRLAWDKPAPTITRECASPGNGRYTHPEQDRLLTVREMSLLQGFPIDYQFKGSVTARYNQIGDAVPPMIGQLIAEEILKDLAGINSEPIDHKGQLSMTV